MQAHAEQSGLLHTIHSFLSTIAIIYIFDMCSCPALGVERIVSYCYYLISLYMQPPTPQCSSQQYSEVWMWHSTFGLQRLVVSCMRWVESSRCCVKHKAEPLFGFDEALYSLSVGHKLGRIVLPILQLLNVLICTGAPSCRCILRWGGVGTYRRSSYQVAF